jgi:hypothetical protein
MQLSHWVVRVSSGSNSAECLHCSYDDAAVTTKALLGDDDAKSLRIEIIRPNGILQAAYECGYLLQTPYAATKSHG